MGVTYEAWATLTQQTRWLITVATGTTAKNIRAEDLRWGEKMAWMHVRNKMRMFFNISTWTGDHIPLEAQAMAEAVGSAFILRFRVAQGGSRGRGEDPLWKNALDFAKETFADVVESGIVSFDDGSDDQVLQTSDGVVIDGAGAEFVPDCWDDTSFDAYAPISVEDTFLAARLNW